MKAESAAHWKAQYEDSVKFWDQLAAENNRFHEEIRGLKEEIRDLKKRLNSAMHLARALEALVTP